MTTESRALADRLLDAQVRFVLAELSGDRLAEVVARDVDDLLAVAARTTPAELADPEDVKRTARLLVERAGGSELVAPLVTGIAAAVYDLTANDEHRLGDVVDRDQVRALVRTVLGMRSLHEELLTRLGESPVVATVASWFVSKLVSDVMQQNRELAERLPGMSSLLSVGERAANRVRGATSRHLDQFLGDMAGKGAQLALADILADLGLGRDELVEEALRYAPGIVATLTADGQLEDLVRRRLEPFFRSEVVLQEMEKFVSAQQG